MFFDKGPVSTKIDVWLNGQALCDPVFKWYPSDLRINLPNKSYSRDNRLNKNESSHSILGLAPRCRLIFSKICIRFGGRSAHPITCYVSWVQNDVNQFGLYL